MTNLLDTTTIGDIQNKFIVMSLYALKNIDADIDELRSSVRKIPLTQAIDIRLRSIEFGETRIQGPDDYSFLDVKEQEATIYKNMDLLVLEHFLSNFSIMDHPEYLVYQMIGKFSTYTRNPKHLSRIIKLLRKALDKLESTMLSNT